MIKKFLAGFVAAFLVLFSLCPVFAFADFPDPDYTGYYSPTQFSSYLGFDLQGGDYYYFIFYGYDNSSGSHISSLLYYRKQFVESIDLSSSALIYTHQSSSSGVGNAWNVYASDNVISYGEDYAPVRFSFDFSSGAFQFYNMEYDVYTAAWSSSSANLTCTGYLTNIESSPSLDVVVDFTPDLSGEVDRSYITSDGLSSMLSVLRMTVTNNCSYPIQYRMSIYKVNQTTFRDGHDTWDASVKFDDDPVFMYYSNSWVYSTKINNEADFWNELPEKQFKSSNWHYVGSGQTDDVVFKYSQIDLAEGVQYEVVVDAIRCSYGVASEQVVFLSSRDPAYPELFQIQGDDIQTVYDSNFSMKHYSDVVYDPTDQSNGVNPFSGLYDGHRYALSYEAKENQDGSIDYNSTSLVDDKSSWAYKQHADAISNANRLRQSYVSTGNGSFDRLNTSFADYFKFLNTALGYFPSSILSLITLGLTTLVVIGIIKAVIK